MRWREMAVLEIEPETCDPKASHTHIIEHCYHLTCTIYKTVDMSEVPKLLVQRVLAMPGVPYLEW